MVRPSVVFAHRRGLLLRSGQASKGYIPNQIRRRPLTACLRLCDAMKRSARPQPGIGAAIREVREKRGLTQEALATEAGTTLSTLSVIERGLSNPTWATVRDIAAALGVSMADLAKRAEKHE